MRRTRDLRTWGFGFSVRPAVLVIDAAGRVQTIQGNLRDWDVLTPPGSVGQVVYAVKVQVLCWTWRHVVKGRRLRAASGWDDLEDVGSELRARLRVEEA